MISFHEWNLQAVKSKSPKPSLLVKSGISAFIDTEGSRGVLKQRLNFTLLQSDQCGYTSYRNAADIFSQRDRV